VDDAGNVVGTMRGAGGPDLLLNTHMDHVAVGDLSRWPHPPHAAEIHDDAIWGRASVDIKGPMAAQIYAVAALRQSGYAFPGDVHVAAVVMEETGGLGTTTLLEWLRPAMALIGEPSNLRVARGHRGRVELHATVQGRAAHASVPHLAVNPHYSLAHFLGAVQSLPMPQEGDFGASSIAPTLYFTDNTSANVIPAEATVVLDYRNVPADRANDIETRLNELLHTTLEAEAQGSVKIPQRLQIAYTGLERELPAIFPSFALPDDHAMVRAAHATISDVLEQDSPVMIWRFATDGGHTATAGIPTIGFGPGDDRLAHTVMEHLPLAQLRAGCAGTIVLVDCLGYLRRDA
jgi:putative selenium metabolism hydrolase